MPAQFCAAIWVDENVVPRDSVNFLTARISDLHGVNIKNRQSSGCRWEGERVRTRGPGGGSPTARASSCNTRAGCRNPRSWIAESAARRNGGRIKVPGEADLLFPLKFEHFDWRRRDRQVFLCRQTAGSNEEC